MNTFWEQTHTLTAEDVDAGAGWRTGRILTTMQEAAWAQCEPLGLGMAAMRAQNLAWVLTRAHLRMCRLPTLAESVTVRTWPKPAQHFFFPRFYRFYAGGEVVGEAATLVVQLDLTSRRMAKPWLAGQDTLACDAEPALALPGNIPLPALPQTVTERVVLYSDLDINGHVNNARYLDWFCDCFDSAHHRAYSLADALVHYNREIRAEERVSLALQQEGLQSVLRGTVEGTPCFAVRGVWQARAAAQPC